MSIVPPAIVIMIAAAPCLSSVKRAGTIELQAQTPHHIDSRPERFIRFVTGAPHNQRGVVSDTFHIPHYRLL